MGVYLRAKFEVSSIIVTGFRQGVILAPPPPTPQNEPLKSPFRLGLRCGPFSEKTLKKSTCIIMIRMIITFGNQIFL